MPVVTPAETTALPAAALAFGARPLRGFALAIALPALLLYVVSAALVIGALMLMARDVDRIEDTRGVSAMHAALDGFLNVLSDAASDEGTWNEAYLNVVVKPDPAWMDSTWGTTARLAQNYDTVLVTDQAGNILFGENNLGAVAGSIAKVYAAAPQMLRELDRGISATGDATALARFAADPQGPAGVAAVSIHPSTASEMAVPRQDRRILWIAKHVTPAVLQEIAAHYQTPLATLADDADPDSSSISLLDAGGGRVATLSWTPDRPGEAAFNRALLAASGIFVIIGGLLVIGLGMLRRTMLRRIARMGQGADMTLPASVPGFAGTASPLRRAGDPNGARPAAPDPLDGVTPADFGIEYQPIFDVRAETVVGVEALLRWNRPGAAPLQQEDLRPSQLAALMERIGILAIRRASEDLAPLIGQTLRVAVAPAQLDSDVFAEKIAGTLGATTFPIRRLELAMDAAELPAAEVLRARLTGLRASGVRVIVTDMALREGLADYLDGRLVDGLCLGARLLSGIEASPARSSWLAAAVETARAAGLDVTVSGVSQKQAIARLVRMGVRQFQGTVFAPPMPIGSLTELLLAPAARRAG